jgi:hypothetical protein
MSSRFANTIVEPGGPVVRAVFAPPFVGARYPTLTPR